MTRTLFLLACAGFLAVSAGSAEAGKPSTDPLDWPHWRGPEMNGVSREKGLVSSWSPEGENLLWRNPTISTRSTPIIMNGGAYILARPITSRPGRPCSSCVVRQVIVS